MSPELIGTLATTIGAVATLFAGMHLMLRRGEKRTDAKFALMDARFAQMDARFDRFEARTDARFDKIDDELRELRSDAVELKVSVARLEGPPNTLLHART